METALSTLDWQTDPDLARLVGRIGPTLAAPELVSALDESKRSGLRSSEVYAGLIGRLHSKLPHDEAVVERTADGRLGTGVDPVWRALAEELGFLPVLDDLAVLVLDRDDPDLFTDAVRHVEYVAARLERAGRPHSAIALAAVGLPDEFETAIFDAGAQLLVVDPSFMRMSDAERVTNLRTMLDEEPYEPPSKKPEQGSDEGLYDSPNPALTAEQLSDWEHRFEQRDESD